MGFGEWLGVVLFIVGIPVAWLMGRRNMQRPAVRYAIQERELVRADDALSRGGLRIEFRDQAVQRLCRTYLAVWVRKGAAVAASSVPRTDPLGLELPDGDRVLSARIVAESRDKIAAAVTVSDDGRRVATSFEFLDADDGFVVEVLHMRHAESLFRGSIPGANVRRVKSVDLTPEGRERTRSAWWGRVRQTGATPAFIMSAVMFVAFTALATFYALDFFNVISLHGFWGPGSEDDRSNAGMVTLYIAMVPVAALMVAATLRLTVRKMPASVVTNDYQEAFEWGPATVYRDGSGRAFSLGDQIHHKDFGHGSIVHITGEGAKLVLHVAFDGGIRKILAAVAPITLVASAPASVE